MCSRGLANFFLEKAKKENNPITNMKLQKLMFIGYGWTLALTDRDLLDGEVFQTWEHGPVLPSVYHEMKHFGSANITEMAIDWDENSDQFFNPRIKTSQTLGLLSQVWDIYGDFSAWSLRELTHEVDTPWSKAVADNKDKILPEDVEAYYTQYITAMLE